MGHYKSNLRDIEFNLFEVLGTGDLLGTGPFAEIDRDTARGHHDKWTEGQVVNDTEAEFETQKARLLS